MPRRLVILPVAVVALALAAWLPIPTVRWLFAPASVAKQLTIGMTPDEVRVVLGAPVSRGFGVWR